MKAFPAGQMPGLIAYLRCLRPESFPLCWCGTPEWWQEQPRILMARSAVLEGHCPTCSAELQRAGGIESFDHWGEYFPEIGWCEECWLGWRASTDDAGEGNLVVYDGSHVVSPFAWKLLNAPAELL